MIKMLVLILVILATSLLSGLKADAGTFLLYTDTIILVYDLYTYVYKEIDR